MPLLGPLRHTQARFSCNVMPCSMFQLQLQSSSLQVLLSIICPPRPPPPPCPFHTTACMRQTASNCTVSALSDLHLNPRGFCCRSYRYLRVRRCVVHVKHNACKQSADAQLAAEDAKASFQPGAFRAKKGRCGVVAFGHSGWPANLGAVSYPCPSTTADDEVVPGALTTDGLLNMQPKSHGEGCCEQCQRHHERQGNGHRHGNAL